VVLVELAVVFFRELGRRVVAERLVDNVAEVGLEADVDETGHGEDFVEDGLAQGVSDASGEVEVLDSLEGFHGEEEEDTLSEHGVAGARVNPPRSEESNKGETARHPTVETHIAFFCAVGSFFFFFFKDFN
jgi:hypothetical protein